MRTNLADKSAGTLEGNIDDGWMFTVAENYNGIARFNFEIQGLKSRPRNVMHSNKRNQ